MKFFTVIFIVAIVVFCLVVPGIQIYNYIDFRHKMENGLIANHFKAFFHLADDLAVTAREGLIGEIEKAGYTVTADDIVFKAYLNGMPRLMSEEIFQITDSSLRKPELRVAIEFEYRVLVFTRRAHIDYTKNLKL